MHDFRYRSRRASSQHLLIDLITYLLVYFFIFFLTKSSFIFQNTNSYSVNTTEFFFVKTLIFWRMGQNVYTATTKIFYNKKSSCR